MAILFGLMAALSWGGGDFAGGLSSRKIGANLAVLYSEILGLILLCVAVPFVRESLPPLNDLLLSFAAGCVGVLGLVCLYQAMVEGQMSIAAPVSAMLAAVLPILVAAFTEGLPGLLQMAGFAFALAAVWLISQKEGDIRPHLHRLADLRLPFLAGLGFGLFMVLMHQASTQAVLWPALVTRIGGTLTMLVYILIRHESLMVRDKSAWPFTGTNAVLDVGGNLFYILAGQAGRMDVAVVLSALYPGVTTLLAWGFLKERLSRAQGLGIVSALTAIVLLTI